MNSNLAPGSDAPPPLARRRWALPAWLPALLIVVAGAVYYGSYWHYWFNPHDEGGTACVIAQRLMNGERPWADVEPGYNIGWFYPLIALFKITGVNYLAARAFFFALATLTALAGCYTVVRVSGSRGLGLVVGLVLIAFPGSQFKNYIPLAQAANTACLVALLLLVPVVSRRWLGAAALAGVVLGLTYLVRVELGFFFTAIWLGLLALTLLDRRATFHQRGASALAGLACLVGGIVVAQAPAYFHLRAQSVAADYWAEYSGWFGFLRSSLISEVSSEKLPAIAPQPAAAAAPIAENAPTENTVAPAAESAPDGRAIAAAAPTAGEPAASEDRSILGRRPLADMWTQQGRKRLLPFLTYAPLVGFVLFLSLGITAFFRAVAKREFQLDSPALLWPLLVGVSLTTFPQFFFFRPDRPHLSEFMPGFIVSMVLAVWLLRKVTAHRTRFLTAAVALLAVFLGVQFVAFGAFALQHPSAGTIAARFGRRAWFRGENGVHVRCFKREAAEFQTVRDAVMKHSQPGDFLVCFPYMPGYNVMTDRRTYVRNVYVDNATRSSDWAEKTIRDFEEKKPAVVIIDDRAINGSEASRFSRWGGGVQKYLETNYTVAARVETVQVFVRGSAKAL